MFIRYQLLRDDDISFEVWENATTEKGRDGKKAFHRMDVIGVNEQMKAPDGNLIFDKFSLSMRYEY